MRPCCMCGELKAEIEFAFRSLATGERQSHCRACHAAYRRRHYLENRAVYIAREVARIASYRLDNRARIRAYLETHPCVDCGEADIILLEFDHRDPAAKREAVTTLAQTKSWTQVAAEIAKCDVRCVACHRRRTALQFGWRSRTIDAAPDLEPTVVDAAGPALAPDGELRRCSRCGEWKPVTEFGIRDRRTGRLRSRCRGCVREASRDHYRRNKERYRERNRRRGRLDRERNRIRVLRYLAVHPCVDCGETDALLLDFDHRDPSTKITTVGALLSRGGWRDIIAEIEKCDVRCVRCHRRRTAHDFGWSRLSEADTLSVYAGVA